MANEVRTAGETLIIWVALIEPEIAVTVAIPASRVETKPVGLIVAMFAGEVVHATFPVTSWVVPSLKAPDTVSCWVRPFATLAAGGLMDNEVRTGWRTVSKTAPRIAPDDAVIVAAPGAAPVTKPTEFTPAMEGSDDAQVTELVTSLVLPSVKAAVAATCKLLPFGTEDPDGAMEMDISVGDGTVKLTVALTEPDTASIRVVPGSFATAVPD